MGTLAPGKKLAFFQEQVLPIEPLSDPSLRDLRLPRGMLNIFHWGVLRG